VELISAIYGMEGPGGYQFVGRTVQVWNRFRRTKDFSQPWLLRFFDQIRFYPVSAAELLRNRESFLEGKFDIKIEEATFRLRDSIRSSARCCRNDRIQIKAAIGV